MTTTEYPGYQLEIRYRSPKDTLSRKFYTISQFVFYVTESINLLDTFSKDQGSQFDDLGTWPDSKIGYVSLGHVSGTYCLEPSIAKGQTNRNMYDPLSLIGI